MERNVAKKFINCKVSRSNEVVSSAGAATVTAWLTVFDRDFKSTGKRLVSTFSLSPLLRENKPF